MNLEQFIEDTKNADLQTKIFEHRYEILILFLIINDVLISVAIIEFFTVSPTYSEGIIVDYPEIQLVQVKRFIILKSLLFYGVAVAIAKRLPRA